MVIFVNVSAALDPADINKFEVYVELAIFVQDPDVPILY